MIWILNFHFFTACHFLSSFTVFAIILWTYLLWLLLAVEQLVVDERVLHLQQWGIAIIQRTLCANYSSLSFLLYFILIFILKNFEIIILCDVSSLTTHCTRCTNYFFFDFLFITYFILIIFSQRTILLNI